MAHIRHFRRKDSRSSRSATHRRIQIDAGSRLVEIDEYETKDRIRLKVGRIEWLSIGHWMVRHWMVGHIEKENLTLHGALS